MHLTTQEYAQFKKKYGSEQVFILPYNDLSFIKDRFTPITHTKDICRYIEQKGRFIHRYDAERNPYFQQIIPFLLIMSSDKKRFYASERIGGDSRLLGTKSLGFGGHINPCDYDGSPIIEGLKREINEELYIDIQKKDLHHYGYVRDQLGDTKDHFGCVFICKSDGVSIKEEESMTGEWMTKEDLIKKYHGFESWSRYIIDHIFLLDKKKKKDTSK